MPTWTLLLACATAPAPPAPSPPASTPSAQAEPAAPPSPAPPAPPERRTLSVWFVDGPAYEVGKEPYLVAVPREIAFAPPGVTTPAAGLLDAWFAGPTAEEQARGLLRHANGATGYDTLKIEAGTLSFRLQPTCTGAGSLSLRDQVMPTLRQLDGVKAIHILDPQGNTLDPTPGVDSVPGCLEP